MKAYWATLALLLLSGCSTLEERINYSIESSLRLAENCLALQDKVSSDSQKLQNQIQQIAELKFAGFSCKEGGSCTGYFVDKIVSIRTPLENETASDAAKAAAALLTAYAGEIQQQQNDMHTELGTLLDGINTQCAGTEACARTAAQKLLEQKKVLVDHMQALQDIHRDYLMRAREVSAQLDETEDQAKQAIRATALLGNASSLFIRQSKSAFSNLSQDKLFRDKAVEWVSATATRKSADASINVIRRGLRPVEQMLAKLDSESYSAATFTTFMYRERIQGAMGKIYQERIKNNPRIALAFGLAACREQGYLSGDDTPGTDRSPQESQLITGLLMNVFIEAAPNSIGSNASAAADTLVNNAEKSMTSMNDPVAIAAKIAADAQQKLMDELKTNKQQPVIAYVNPEKRFPAAAAQLSLLNATAAPPAMAGKGGATPDKEASLSLDKVEEIKNSVENNVARSVTTEVLQGPTATPGS